MSPSVTAIVLFLDFYKDKIFQIGDCSTEEGLVNRNLSISLYSWVHIAFLSKALDLY